MIVVVGSGSSDSSDSSAGDGARDLAVQILDRLRAAGQTVAVAESLTGGLVAAALPDVPGASMAEGVRTRLGATYGVATTGVAGPETSDGQPVGTAHIAVSVADDTVVRTIALAGDRQEIRRLTVEHALGLLLGRLGEESY